MELPFKLRESTLFFSYLRMVIVPSDAEDRLVSVKILRKGNENGSRHSPLQQFDLESEQAGIIEAMVDRAEFPAAYEVEILSRAGLHVIACRDLVEQERRDHARSSLTDFLAAVDLWRQSHPGATPRVLDIGGRARSGYLLADHIPGCAVTVLDIVDDMGVDIVADIHEMSTTLGDTRFDFLICVSVFEHLVMPWKAAIEINRILADDGIALIQTHQTVGLHDMPWDYFRFSDQAWRGLFNEATGFEVVKTAMDVFVRIVPMRIFNVEPGGENSGGFYESAVVIRKIGPTTLEWPVSLAAIVNSTYPG